MANGIDLLFFTLPVGPQADSLARDWCNANCNKFTGTLSDLNAMVLKKTQQCASDIQSKGIGISAAGAANMCGQIIDKKYAEDRQYLEGDQQATQSQIQFCIQNPGACAQGGLPKEIIGIVILVLIVVVIMFLLLN